MSPQPSFLVLCVLLALLSAGLLASAQQAPLLPTAFYGKFVEYTAPDAKSPPYIDGVPQAPFYGSRGRVYYDWRTKDMIEVREDFCVNIFSFSNLFPCTFHNTKGTSYLISFNTTNLPPCCIFGQPWQPPPPDFLRQSSTRGILRNREMWSGRLADWYIIPSIEPPTGPFWFAYRNSTTSPQVYLSFSFPGMQGWIQQNFFDISYSAPDPSVWKLPPQCIPAQGQTLPNCGFFPENMHSVAKLALQPKVTQ